MATYLQSMNSGKQTYTGGIPFAAKLQDANAASVRIPQNLNFSIPDFVSNIQGGVSDGIASSFDTLSSAKSGLKSSLSQPSGSSESFGLSDPGIDYYNADLAKHYGMSAQTAYAEAMSNTAYQRAVKDMKAAGLNPALLVQHGFAQPASGGFAGSQVGSSYGRSGGSSAKSVSKYSGLWQGLASLATAGAVFGLTKGSLGAVGAAVTAKTLATVAGQAAKAMAG